MITTRTIPNIGSPPGDPTCILAATLYWESTLVGVRPFPCVVGTRAGGFTDGGIQQLSKPFGHIDIGLAAAGFLCLAFQIRLLPGGSPGQPVGQTTPGTWHEQTDDMKLGVQYMRQAGGIVTEQGFDVTGFVASLGGSGAAHHAVWVALEGTEFDDRVDAAIGMSTITDYSDRSNGVNGYFIQTCATYADELDTDIAALLAKSPIALDLANAKPIRCYNGDDENMPLTQLTRFNQAMADAGAVDYLGTTLTGEGGRKHAFAEWPFIHADATTFLLAKAAEFLDEEPPPEPPPGGQVKVVAEITGMSPGVAMNLAVSDIHTVTGLESDVRAFDFISDPTSGGVNTKKAAPVGVYVLVDTSDGVPAGNIATRAWWDFAYVDGARFPTNWTAVNGGGRQSFNWTALNAFLAAAAAKSKPTGVSIEFGIKTPPWVYQGPKGCSFFTQAGPYSGTMPIPWDTNYLKSIKAFITNFASLYDANLNLNYVVIGGIGQLLDTILVRSGDYAALNTIAQAAGYTDVLAGWMDSASQICDFWAKAMKQTMVFLAIELPVPLTNGGLEGIDQFTRDAIQRYKAGLGVMTLELDGSTAAGSTLSLNTIIRDADRNTRAYRFWWPSSNPACDPLQDPEAYDPELGLRTAAEAGIAVGVSMEEFFEEDILIETAPYPADFTQFQTDLTANV
jgi:hypothetical protein